MTTSIRYNLSEICNIEGDVLYCDRSKTGFEGCAILTPPILRILDKYKNRSKYLFPDLKGIPANLVGKQRDEYEEKIRANLNRMINWQIKKICQILDLERFTFYSARETMSTRLLRMGFTLGEVGEDEGVGFGFVGGIYLSEVVCGISFFP